VLSSFLIFGNIFVFCYFSFFIIFNMESTLYEKLRQLRNEEIVWIIYIGIIILSFYSNKLEKNYFIFKDSLSRKKYREVMILIFSILVFVYFYFFKDSFSDLKNLSLFDSDKKKNLTYLSFVGSLLILISGFIFLYIAIIDEDIDVEIAFN